MVGGGGWTEGPEDARDLPGLFDDDEPPIGAPVPTARAATEAQELRVLAALVPVVALVPLGYASLYPVYRLLNAATNLPSYPVFLAFFTAVGLLAYLEPVQKELLAALFGARSPTPTERDELDPAWSSVLRRGGIPVEHYQLAVIDSYELTAPAVGGRVVTVTTGALNVLSDDELAGAMAHELGHHRGPQALVLPLVQWLVLPLSWLADVGRALARTSWLAALGSLLLLAFGSWAFADVAELTLALLVLAGVGLVLLATGLLGEMAGQVLGLLIGRFTQPAADHAAVELGFGRQLVAALDRYARLGPQATGGGRVAERIFASSPPTIRRLGRVRTLVDGTR